jgi:outer membrane biogenesis lipoprotein LolB
MRFTVLAMAAFALCGCISPQKLKATEQSYETFQQQKQAHDATQRCTDAGAIPGSMEHLACMADSAAPKPGTATSP